MQNLRLGVLIAEDQLSGFNKILKMFVLQFLSEGGMANSVVSAHVTKKR